MPDQNELKLTKAQLYELGLEWEIDKCYLFKLFDSH